LALFGVPEKWQNGAFQRISKVPKWRFSSLEKSAKLSFLCFRNVFRWQLLPLYKRTQLRHLTPQKCAQMAPFIY
jgi:hypothetical protein